MKKLKIKLMYTEAKNRLNDAEILGSSLKTKSDSQYLLELLAFEMLLKAVAFIHCKDYKRGHCYAELYKNLPIGVQKNIIERARLWAEVSLTQEKMIELLEKYEKNFIGHRYPFEKYEKMTEKDFIEYGDLWVELGALEEEAEFQNHTEELYGITKALMQEIESFVV